MGVGPFSRSSSSCYDTSAKTTTVPPNPNPKNYKVLRYEEIGGNLVIELQYLDCTNYEGRKILVYRDLTYSELLAWSGHRGIDPHFHDDTNTIAKSPFARFKPTKDGWHAAIFLASH
jgi:hypothetical protein